MAAVVQKRVKVGAMVVVDVMFWPCVAQMGVQGYTVTQM